MQLAIQQSLPTIKVESPGTHGYDTDAAKDMEKLFQLLLVKAGYTKPLEWTLKFVETLHCSPQTPPLTFTGIPRLWGIPVKVKPGMNDTKYHSMTLMMPEKSSYRAIDVLNQLRGCVKSINRNWLKEYKERFRVIPVPEIIETPVIMQVKEPLQPITRQELPIIEEPVVIEVQEEVIIKPINGHVKPKMVFNNLHHISSSNSKLRFVLEMCLEIEKSEIKTSSSDDFRDRLSDMCGWEKTFSSKSIGKAIKGLIDNEYLQALHNDRNKHVGYILTNKGKRVIEVHCETLEPIKKVELPKILPPTPVDYKPLVRSLKQKADEVATACRRLTDREAHLEDLRRQKAEIDKQIADTEKEIVDLVKVVVPTAEAAIILSKFAAQPIAYKEPT